MSADHAAGDLIRSTVLPPDLRPPHAASAYRMFYQGLGYDGRPRSVTGTAMIPQGQPPTGGWPCISYGHGSTGLSDAAAPSRAGFSTVERDFLDRWLAAGFALAATDYEGLSTPGPHPYFNGEAVADDVIDAVRALRHLDPHVSDKWLVVGFSQGGHAALFTALLATAYAPELDFTGTIALAPPVSLLKLIAGATAEDGQPVSPLVPVTLAGVAVSRDFNPAGLLPDVGLDLIVQAEQLSLLDMLRRTVTFTNAETGFTGITADREVQAALQSSDAPSTTLDRPLLLAAGGSDDIVPTDLLAAYGADLQAAATTVDLRTYPSATHTGLLGLAVDDCIAWARKALSTPHRAPTEPAVGDSRFSLLDATGDGFLRRDDYEAFALRLVQSLGQAPHSPLASAVRDGYRGLWHAVAARADTEGDGRVSEEEYRAWLAAEAATPSRFADDIAPLARAVIALVDTDASGSLHQGEFTRLMAACRIPADEAEQLFTALDTDGTGSVTTEEIIEAVRTFTTGADSPGYWLFGRF